MVTHLLATKLFLPQVRDERVERARLLARLDALLRPTVRLALISAPAGFGKTSLLAEWLALRGKPAAWLALDADDNQPGLFLAYLVAALERAQPGLMHETRAMLDAQPPPPVEAKLAVLVNELAGCAGADPENPLIIALDDFQLINAPEARDCVIFLTEHLPPVARLAIATRSDPPLPLARMRARGQMIELRAADLRFTIEEAAEFLARGTAGLAENSGLRSTAEALTERTEGWAAGLQMAAVALQASPGADLAQFVQSFTGSHRFVLDYLAEEVLSRLPEETVRFLLHTAVLDRFCAELCQTLLEDTEAVPAGTHTAQNIDYQAQLEALERANLFLIPLDTERRWYRYHHLFSDLLRARLKQSHPGAAAGLHRKASAWFEEAGLIAEAIKHALAAAASTTNAAVASTTAPAAAEADYERAAGLVEAHTINLFIRGELHGVQRWMGMLPASLADRRPWLCIQRCWMLAFAGQLGEVELVLQKALAHKSALPEHEQRLLEGHAAALRVYMLMFAPDSTPAFALFQEVVEKLPPSIWARGVAQWAVGFALRNQGNLEQAAAIFDDMFQKRYITNDPWGTAMVATDLGVVRRQQGRLREALEVYQNGLAFVESYDARKNGYTGRLLTAMASALYEQNALDAAQRCLEEAIQLNQRWRNPNHLVYSYINQGRVLMARGALREAAGQLDAAAQILRELPVLPMLTQSVHASRLQLDLAAGNGPPPGGPLEEAIQAALAEAFQLERFSEPREGQYLLYARVLLAQKRPAKALLLLEGVEGHARRGGREMILVELLGLKALGLYQKGETGAALAALEEAVTRAAPEGVLRSIADSAPLVPGGLRQLLEALRRRLPGLQGYLERLLAALPEAPARPTTAGTAAGAPVHPIELVEPLSERELEVLRLLAEGMTNAQIAERLVISTGTVKAHTAAIFRKLDTGNRTQAVARAREFGLV